MRKKIQALLVIAAVSLQFFAVNSAKAQTNGFALQVSPSPIIETIKPGTSKTVELKIRNQNTQKETLKMALRAFTVNSESGEVQLKNDEPVEVLDWVRFAQPVFDVDPGQWYTQKINFSVPENAGFSYSFALTVSRANPTKEQGGSAAIEGSVAVFVLLNTDRSDAKRQLEIVSFESKKKVYEYLPSTFTMQIKNTGNTIVQPAGNIYIQRSADSANPLGVLPVNSTGGYILPNSNRSLVSEWKGGFPVFKQSAENANKDSLVWDWSQLQNFRMGRFVARAIVIYNNGTSDVPVEALVTFWVIPWKLLGICFLIVLLLIVGVVTIVRKSMRIAHKKKTDGTKE